MYRLIDLRDKSFCIEGEGKILRYLGYEGMTIAEAENALRDDQGGIAGYEIEYVPEEEKQC